MSAGGGVQRIEITEQECPVFGGAEFAGVGNYERLHGTVFGELDPTHRLKPVSSTLTRRRAMANLWRSMNDPRAYRHISEQYPNQRWFRSGCDLLCARS